MKTRPKCCRSIVSTCILPVLMVAVFMLIAPGQAHAQDAKTAYPRMFPIEQYLMERSAEITLAKSAAPESISKDADVIVLNRHGYETVSHGKNGFVCAVLRSWTAGIDDPEFWNPTVRAPICFNPAGARSYLPQAVRKTELLLAGRSKAQMFDDIKIALDKKELPSMETGAMCYMMSKQGHLSDRDGHWHPHLMFFAPLADPATWGANLHGSPVLGVENAQSRVTVFLIPVAMWSDGTMAEPLKDEQ